MKVKVFKFEVSNSSCLKDIEESKKLYNEEKIEETINDYLINNNLELVDMKVNNVDINYHNNGGNNEIELYYALMVKEKEYDYKIILQLPSGMNCSLSNMLDTTRIAIGEFEKTIISKSFNDSLIYNYLVELMNEKKLYFNGVNLKYKDNNKMTFELIDSLGNKEYLNITRGAK